MRTPVVVALLALSMLVWPAHAGTQQDPEITDAAGDQQLAGAAPDPGAVFNRGDVIRGWLTDDGALVTFHVQASNSIGGGAAGVQTTLYQFFLHLSNGGTDFVAGARASSTGVTPTGVASAARAAGAVLSVDIPRETLGVTEGGTLSKLWVEAEGRLYSQDLPRTVSYDRAPNSGFGRDYVVAPPAPPVPEGPAAVAEAINGSYALVELAFDQPDDGAYVFSWAGGNGTFDANYTIQGTTGTATLRILDPNNATVLQCPACSNGTAGVQVVAGNGTWMLSLNTTGFIGNVTMSVGPAGAMVLPDDVPAAKNETADDAGGANEAPLPWGLPVGALFALAAARRRR